MPCLAAAGVATVTDRAALAEKLTALLDALGDRVETVVAILRAR
jgi:hypothetical protein